METLEDIPPNWQQWCLNFIEITEESNKLVNSFNNEEYEFTKVCKYFIENNELIQDMLEIVDPETPYYYWISNLLSTQREAKEAIERYYEKGVEDRSRDICLQIIDLNLELEEIGKGIS